MAVTTSEDYFGEYEGKKVSKFTISNNEGISVSIINYGATITNLFVPDRNGIAQDVVLGFKNLEGYLTAKNLYMGSICGRFANRIANGRFKLNNVEYNLPKNDGKNSLHGGIEGFDKVYWTAEILENKNAIKFSYRSKDGEEGFPGNLLVTVTYKVLQNDLEIEFYATTDKATPINLTSHCYFNLSGGYERNIFNHELMINADTYLEVDESLIPTGKMLKIDNSKMNFQIIRKIGDIIEEDTMYDYCWVVNKAENILGAAALLKSTESGIQMLVSSTEPGLHFYSGNFLPNNLSNTNHENGYGKCAGLCLEVQHFPDSPNKKNFPNTILQSSESYHQKTIYSFTTN